MRIYKAGMGLLTICLIALAVMGCEQIIGLDKFEVEDGIEGEGDPCEVALEFGYHMEGECIPKEAPPEDCPGGIPHEESANCPNPDMLKCCIREDQCERDTMIEFQCYEEECYPNPGWQMGCPNGWWCCL